MRPPGANKRPQLQHGDEAKKKKRGAKGRESAENKKRGEECGICPPDFPSRGRMCRSPTSESFQRLCANEKRRGGGGVGFFFAII